MLNAVIFDLDGVVVDSHPLHRRAWRRFLDSVGVTVTDDELEFVTHGGKRDDILQHFLGRLTKSEIAEYGHRKELLFREEALDVAPLPGLPQFLNELESARLLLAVASSASRGRVIYMLERLQWLARFQAIITGDDVSRGKPDPSVFLRALAELRTDPAYTVVMEDSVAGVEAAVRAGMRCIGLANRSSSAMALREAGASLVVPDFTHLSLSRLRDLMSNPGRNPGTKTKIADPSKQRFVPFSSAMPALTKSRGSKARSFPNRVEKSRGASAEKNGQSF